MDTPQTPERRAAEAVWGALSESQQGGKGCDRAEGESREGRGVSRWVLSQFPLPHSLLMPGGLVPGAVHQAEKQEADPSWRKETECPPGPQWTDWLTRMGST